MNQVERPHEARHFKTEQAKSGQSYKRSAYERIKNSSRVVVRKTHIGEVDDGSVNKVLSSLMFLPEVVIL
jgi:hypothetical protein